MPSLPISSSSDSAMPDSDATAHARSTRPVETIIVILISAFSALFYAYHAGQDLNWDQLNYHIYSVFSLHHSRICCDIIPSQLQTWTNPFANIPAYILVKNTPPWFATAILAVLASFSIPLIYFIAKAVIDPRACGQKGRILLATLAALGAFFSPIYLSEVGTTFSDYYSSILLLGAMLILIRNDFRLKSQFAAGALLGLACALKLTNLVFVLAWLAAILAVDRAKALRPMLACGIGLVTGYLPTGGTWNIYLYKHFGNPVFPLYNNIFKSASYASVDMLDMRFKPHGILEALTYFPKWALGQSITTEVAYRDVRFAIVAILSVVAALPLGQWLVSRDDSEDPQAPFHRRPSVFLLVFFFVSFAVWLGKFGIQRYAMPIEQIAVLVIFIVLARLISNPRVLLSASVMATALIATTALPANWGREPFTQNWYDLDIPPSLKKDNTLFVMLSGEATAFIAAFMPRSNSFVRIEGNMPLDPTTGDLGRQAKEKMAMHKGEIRSLAPADYNLSGSRERLLQFGLAIENNDCVVIGAKSRRLKSCKLVRVAN